MCDSHKDDYINVSWGLCRQCGGGNKTIFSWPKLLVVTG